MSSRVLVAGVGNVFLRDDGFGSEVARRLLGRPLPDEVRVVDYGIRGMHLAYDLLEGYDALVIVDALPHKAPGTATDNVQPGDITVLEVGPDDLGSGEFDAHGMDPVAVLGSLDALGGRLPRTIVVGCRPLDVSDGMGLTPAVAAAVDVAADRVTLVVGDLLAARAAGADAKSGG